MRFNSRRRNRQIIYPKPQKRIIAFLHSPADGSYYVNNRVFGIGLHNCSRLFEKQAFYALFALRVVYRISASKTITIRRKNIIIINAFVNIRRYIFCRRAVCRACCVVPSYTAVVVYAVAAIYKRSAPY